MTPTMSPATSGAIVTRHTAVEDVFGVLTGTLLAALGVWILKASAAVTGGTAGLALLLSYSTHWSFAALFLAVNVPFFGLAAKVKGWSFTLRSIVAVVLLSAFAHVTAAALGTATSFHPNPLYGVVAGNLLAGVGLLILFRHGSSLGGFNIIALVAQEQFGWRAGWVQLALDTCVVVASLTVVPADHVALSALGALVLSLVLVLNHRPGRYAGETSTLRATRQVHPPLETMTR